MSYLTKEVGINSDFTPYPLDDECPCGSGQSYRDCCALKQFRFGFDEEGNIVRRLHLSDGAVEAFEESVKSFELLYGRTPSQDGLVFGHVSDPTDSVYASARALISAGIDPAYVYAYIRTNGLLPTEFNTDLITDADLELFEEFVEEFRAPVDLDGGSVPSYVFVLMGNELIAEEIETVCSRMRMVLVDFLSRHMSPEQRQSRMEPDSTSREDFTVRAPLDYALFSALKTKRTLDSIGLLSKGDDAASIYSLARSIFENTVYLDSIADKPSLFWDGISPRTDSVNYEFGRYPDGRINLNHVVHKQTGVRARTNMRFSDLAEASGRPHTRDLYSLFYVTASQYVHVDVLSARGYFYDTNPFDELDETLLASLLAVVLVGDLLRALQRSEGVQKEFALDVRSFLASTVDGLVDALTYINSDPDHVNEVFDTLRDLVTGWRSLTSNPRGT